MFILVSRPVFKRQTIGLVGGPSTGGNTERPTMIDKTAAMPLTPAMPGVERRERKERTPAVSMKACFGDMRRASEILKSMAHESRLIILCALSEGDKSVSELEAILELRQPAVSQQLARLRGDRLVRTRREGKMIYYSLTDDEQVRALVAFLCEVFNNRRGAGAG